MSVHVSYRLRAPLLCVDRNTRTLISVDGGNVLTRIGDEAPNMIALSFSGREVLAFASDLEERADAVIARAQA